MSDGKPEISVVVSHAVRWPTRLDDMTSSVPSPAIAAVVDSVDDPAAPVWLAGGEPTLRADLPQLISAFSGDVGVRSDGLAFGEPGALAPLIDAGLNRVRVRLHSARRDAHDWLVRKRGAWRKTVRALEACARAGVVAELEATVTRPTMAYLDELVDLAEQLDVSAVVVRMLEHRGPAAGEQIMLAPRFGLLSGYLQRAELQAISKSIALTVEGIPACVAGDLDQVVVDWRGVDQPARTRCPACPRMSGCPGTSAAHVERFGWREVPAAQVDAEASSLATIELDGRTTRQLRSQLVHIARSGATTLRFVGRSLHHSQAAVLVREALLLAFDRVDIDAEASPLAAMPSAAVFNLKGLARIDAPIYAADAAGHDAHLGITGAFDATLAGLSRFAETTGCEVGVYAVVQSETDEVAFREAWRAGVLPGEPAFRYGRFDRG